jgi:hypothetical protein
MKARTSAPEGGGLAQGELAERFVRVVDGLVEAVGARAPVGQQAPQVVRGERRRVGRHHQLVAEAPLQPEAGTPNALYWWLPWRSVTL